MRKRKRLGAILFCLFLGWWGFPRGLVMTPIQLVNNLVDLLTSRPDARPSPELLQTVRSELVAGRLPMRSRTRAV